MSPNRMWSLVEAVAAAVIATAIITFVGGVISGSWEVPVGLGVGWLLAALVVVGYARARLLRFGRPMSLRAVRSRIAAADRDIWSFQISGSEFTANSVRSYEDWLATAESRNFRIAFANPDNDGLLRSIVKLSGLHKQSNERDALDHLRQVIRTSLRRYVELQTQFPQQVDVRVYDCSPPCSIHAVDPRSTARHRSIYVEFYLPELAARERPCLLLTRHHSYYERFVEQSLAWFEEARPIAGTQLSEAARAPRAMREPRIRRLPLRDEARPGLLARLLGRG